VYVDLHHCAPKGGNSDHWRSNLLGIIAEVHVVLDRILEVVEEGIFYVDFADLDRSRMQMSKGVGLKPVDDEYGVAILSGISRISTLVLVIKEFLTYFYFKGCI